MLETVKTPSETPIKLTAFSHGGGCGCKISPAILADILKNQVSGIIPPQLLVGIETADDAAVYQINDEQALIATTDFFMPIVDDPYDFGQIAATNAISDVYAMGGTPIMALAIVAMPIAQLSTETIGKILQGGQEVCRRAGIPIAGGHTIDSVEPIYGLVVMGLIHPKNIKKNASAHAGDVLILAKPLGVGILAAALKKGALSAQGYTDFIRNTTQLNTPGQPLSHIEGVHAMTDVTGFGLAGHLLEIARGSHLHADIQMHSIPLLDQARSLATAHYVTGASARNWASYGEHIEINPALNAVDQALLTDPQTSGGLLVSCAPECAAQVLEIFKTAGFMQASIIGQLNTLNQAQRYVTIS